MKIEITKEQACIIYAALCDFDASATRFSGKEVYELTQMIRGCATGCPDVVVQHVGGAK